MSDHEDLNYLSPKRQQTVQRLRGIKNHILGKGDKVTAVEISRISAHFDENGVWHSESRFKSVRHETVGRYREYWANPANTLTRTKARKEIASLKKMLEQSRKTCSSLLARQVKNQRQISQQKEMIANIKRQNAELENEITKITVNLVNEMSEKSWY